MNESKKLFQKNFILVVVGQIISLFGNGIIRFALPLYLLRETNSPTMFGLVTACSFLPMIVLSLFGGVMADRLNKRNIMVVLDFSTAGMILLLTMALGKLPLVPLLMVALMLLYGISGAYQPAVQASIPLLVSQENILPAGAVVNQISALANLLGPVIGGVLFGSFGIKPILIVSIACFFVSAVMEIFIQMPYEKSKEKLGVLQIIKGDVKDSVGYMLHEKPALIKIIGLLTVFNLVLTSMLIVGLPVLIVENLGMSDQLFGISQGVLALGGLCGGILTALLSKKLKMKNAYLLLLCGSLSVGSMALPFFLSATPMVSYLVITGACFVVMVFATMFSIQMLAIVQIETPPQLVGKVIATMMSFAMCAQPLGQAMYGIIFDRFSEQIGIVLLTVSLLAVAISAISRKIFSD